MPALPEFEPDGSERRVAPRMRTLKRAKIIFNNGYSTFDCILRNISSTGALLTIDEAAHLPKEFTIVIGEGPDQRPAKLVYRRGLFAGIRFRDVPDEMDEDIGPRLSATSQPHGVAFESLHGHGPAAAASDMSDRRPAAIRRITPEPLPETLVALFAWS